MLDLHLFLGRKPTNVYAAPAAPGPDGATVDGVGVGGGDEAATAEAGEGEAGGKRGAIVGYTVSELNPDLVHYGNFPQQVIFVWSFAVVVSGENVMWCCCPAVMFLRDF